MTKASPELESIDVRNQVMLERLKSGEHKKFTPFLKRIEKEIRALLSGAGDAIETKKRLNILISDVTATQKAIYDDYNKQLSLDLIDIGEQQAGFEAESYNRVVTDFEAVIPSDEQMLTALRVNPLQVEGYTGNLLLEPFIKDWSDTEIKRVNNVITQGFYQGQTNAQITRNIRGTKANNYNDGAMATVNRSNSTLVRTAVQHASTQARVATMKQNDDLIKGYEWVSTLDSRTSAICSGLDGRRFKIGKGPLPPAHPNCRSTTTPVLSEKFDFLDSGATRASKGADGGKQVSTNKTYYSWLKKQPKAFQENAIGVKKSALLRNGGLTADEFAKLSLNRNFEPLTLDEMYQKMPTVFESAGVEL